MKKLILISLVTLMSVSSAFADSEKSLLQHVQTESCSASDLRTALTKTAAIESSLEQGLSIIEKALDIKAEDKAQGVVTTIEGSYLRSNGLRHSKSVARAQAQANLGQVGITAPIKFDVVFNVKDGWGDITQRGRAMVQVTCRISKGSQTTAQLISFDIQSKEK
jgi:hypothetical protein